MKRWNSRQEPMYWIRVTDRFTDEVLYEYNSVFTDIDEAVEDVRRMTEEGVIPYARRGYMVKLFDTHPDVIGAKRVGERLL